MPRISTRHAVKAKKMPKMKVQKLSGLKSAVKMKAGGLKFGKKTTKHANPLGMKSKA